MLDRLFWVSARRFWSGWKQTLIVVSPETVVQWHGAGFVFLSTPNREIFSLGHEPSPMNREHIKKLNRAELDELIRPFFQSVEVWGQSFWRPELRSWDEDVRVKIEQIAAGTRWKQARSSLKENVFAKFLYQNTFIRSVWKYLRWGLIDGFNRKRAIANWLYGYNDFYFIEDTSRALWFCVFAIQNRRNQSFRTLVVLGYKGRSGWVPWHCAGCADTISRDDNCRVCFLGKRTNATIFASTPSSVPRHTHAKLLR